MLRRQTFKIHPCPGSIAADIGPMNDDDKGGPKEPNYPDPEEIKKTLEGMFGQLGKGAFTFTGGEDPSFTDETKGEEKDFEDPDVDDIFEFDLLPRDIKAHLDRFVIRQDEAKKALSIAVCDHYNHVKTLKAQEEEEDKIELQKQNVMVVGPTGVGKTYLVKHIAELIGVPFVKADATKFSETGYVGGDVDDLVRELVSKANGDVSLAEYGIIYIDEVDKLASSGGGGMIGRDVSGRGVQTTLLKLMEETEVPLRNPQDMRGQMMAMMDMQNGKKNKESINTKHILFIVSGAFSGLEKIVRKRSQAAQIGFSTEQAAPMMDNELFKHVTTQDYIDFGFEAEFIGRIPVRVVCEHLEASDLEAILKYSEGSLLRQYEREFEAYGIDLKVKDSGITRIAEMAADEKTGARGLMTVGERILRDFKYELPGTSVTELVLDVDLIDNREKHLSDYRELGQELVVEKARQEVEAFIREFKVKHSVVIKLTDEAVAKLVKMAGEQARSVFQVARQHFKDYQFGLKLIQKNTGQAEFVLTETAVNDPDKFLSELVVKSYKEA
ncbi:MAG TPA: ATP-dependent protease [Verrucomicrobiales bacterium]|nr:ATP-dependent protease [Verrucomicrobiales bacterium]